MGENKTIYAEKTLKSIEEYLLNGTYPVVITSLETIELRKQRKRGFREIIKKIKGINLKDQVLKEKSKY